MDTRTVPFNALERKSRLKGGREGEEIKLVAQIKKTLPPLPESTTKGGNTTSIRSLFITWWHNFQRMNVPFSYSKDYFPSVGQKNPWGIDQGYVQTI